VADRAVFESAVARLGTELTDSRIPVAPLYTAADVAPDLDERNGYPGQLPFTRGARVYAMGSNLDDVVRGVLEAAAARVARG